MVMKEMFCKSDRLLGPVFGRGGSGKTRSIISVLASKTFRLSFKKKRSFFTKSINMYLTRWLKLNIDFVPSRFQHDQEDGRLLTSFR